MGMPIGRAQAHAELFDNLTGKQAMSRSAAQFDGFGQSIVPIMRDPIRRGKTHYSHDATAQHENSCIGVARNLAF